VVVPPIGQADWRHGSLALYPGADDAVGMDLLDRLRHERDAEPRRHQVDDRWDLRRFLTEDRAEAGALATGDDAVVETGPDCAREQDQSLVRQSGERQGRAFGPRIVLSSFAPRYSTMASSFWELLKRTA
jgi:hypothetical protein